MLILLLLGMLALGLAITSMTIPITYALNASVMSDRIGDQVIMDIFTGDVVKYVDRRDSDYISFVDIINVKIRLTEESMLVTLHIKGKIPTESTEDVNFAFGILAAPSEEGVTTLPFAPTEYPLWFLVVGYQTDPTPGWESWLFVVMAPGEESLHLDMPFNMEKKHIAISVSTSLLPTTTFYWRGIATYQNTALRDSYQALYDFTNIKCLV